MTTAKGKAGKGVSGQRGFTLLELVVGVGLLTVVLGVSTPAFSSLRSRYVLDGASRQLAMEITKARMQAIAQNRTVRLRLTGPRTYVLEASQDGATWVGVSGPTSLPAGIGLTSGSTGTPRFNRQGLAPSSTTISVANRAGTKSIQTSVVGRVRRS